ncbi:MAG: nickel pincer cofactor biosynthesis protein LarC [Planctomycetes bacterium]|nr:nickel pincer cofactor biosynthesis protein LarC [Planctomycetota bacterium]
MKLAYFDCFSGASGDMILGALADSGLDFRALQDGLARLHLPGYSLASEPVRRNGIAATRVIVRLDSGAQARTPHRRLGDILAILDASSLPDSVRAASRSIFTRLAEAEARVHRIAPQEVHFHEVGAVDAIVDVVGAALGLHLLAIETVACSELTTGYGFVDCEHGRLPVPAPATAELIRNVPSRSGPVEMELLTPTGAAILTTLASNYGPRPLLTLETVGYGAGSTVLPNHPNLLRLLVGQTPSSAGREQVWVVETNLDDLSPQAVGYVSERLFQAGALDVFTVPVQMKKSRPGVLLCVLASAETLPAVEILLFKETTTFGIRRHLVERATLEREIVSLDTPFGQVRVKLGRLAGRVLRASPEYEDCRRLAESTGVAFTRIYAAAVQQAAHLLAE